MKWCNSSGFDLSILRHISASSDTVESEMRQVQLYSILSHLLITVFGAQWRQRFITKTAHTRGRSYIYFVHGSLSLNTTLAYLRYSTPKLFILGRWEAFSLIASFFLDYFLWQLFDNYTLFAWFNCLYCRPPSPGEIENVDHVPRFVLCLVVFTHLSMFNC
jgi:hypothetical protein